MFVVYNENLYKGREVRIEAMKFNISKVLYRFRKMGFISLKN